MSFELFLSRNTIFKKKKLFQNENTILAFNVWKQSEGFFDLVSIVTLLSEDGRVLFIRGYETKIRSYCSMNREVLDSYALWLRKLVS